MLLDRMGYILSELFTLMLVILFIEGFLRLRRGGKKSSLLILADRNLLLRPITINARAPQRLLRYARIAALSLVASGVEYFALSQFGATILVGALVLTCSAIVRRTLA